MAVGSFRVRITWNRSCHRYGLGLDGCRGFQRWRFFIYKYGERRFRCAFTEKFNRRSRSARRHRGRTRSSRRRVFLVVCLLSAEVRDFDQEAIAARARHDDAVVGLSRLAIGALDCLRAFSATKIFCAATRLFAVARILSAALLDWVLARQTVPHGYRVTRSDARTGRQTDACLDWCGVLACLLRRHVVAAAPIPRPYRAYSLIFLAVLLYRFSRHADHRTDTNRLLRAGHQRPKRAPDVPQEKAAASGCDRLASGSTHAPRSIECACRSDFFHEPAMANCAGKFPQISKS